MDKRDTITLKTSDLYKIAYFVPLCTSFVYFSQRMLFGPSEISLPGVTVNEDMNIIFKDHSGNTFLQGRSEINQDEGDVDFCRGQFQQNYKGGCLEQRHNQFIKIDIDDSEEDGVSCYKVRREGLRCSNQMVKDCYSLSGQHWYAGFEAVSQVWPSKQASSLPGGVLPLSDRAPAEVQLSFGPYVSGDFGTHRVELENVLERLFISSSGVGIMVSEDSPLYLGFNHHGDNQLCLAATYDHAHYIDPMGRPPVLEYTVCKADNVKDIQTYMQKRFIPRPEGTPSLDIFKQPIWSTWAQFNKDVNQSAVLDFANQIQKYKFPCSQIEIDDDWTIHYGDLVFDPVKFPNPKRLISELQEKGFPVTLWTHPFFNLDSESFKEAFQNKYAILSKGSDIPALIKWWNGDMAAILDVTNPAAVLWYKNKLTGLQEKYNISSFKFDAGESLYVPRSHQTFSEWTSTNDFAKNWAELAFTADPKSRRQEVRAAYRSQRLPIFTRLMDRLSSWDEKAGLQSIIPSVLTFGMIGYPFVLPDMIGGNAYSDLETFGGGAYPDRELYIRWLQVNALLPAMQFSVVPWIYDSEVIAITQKFIGLREKYVGVIVNLAEESVETGNPIIRPLWWLAPKDEQALASGDEFLLGNDLLVAPVVVEGARKRDIYLPAGSWKDLLRKENIDGPILLKEYAVALDELPHFERITN